MYTLYTFTGSVWAAVPELAVIELGYTDDQIEKKTINLIHGENFSPDFIKLNPNATLPTLEAEGKVYTNTADVIKFLVQNAPNKVAKAHTDFIAEIHAEKVDPNFAMLLARSDQELAAKTSDFPGLFLRNRQEKLIAQSKSTEGAEYTKFYTNKIQQNGGLLAVYESNVPEEVKEGFFAKSIAHVEALKEYISTVLPHHLPKTSAFIGGDKPGEDDFHLAAWLTRIAATSQAKDASSAMAAVGANLGTTVPESVQAYWGAWVERPSWKTVYAAGLH